MIILKIFDVLYQTARQCVVGFFFYSVHVIFFLFFFLKEVLINCAVPAQFVNEVFLRYGTLHARRFV